MVANLYSQRRHASQCSTCKQMEALPSKSIKSAVVFEVVVVVTVRHSNNPKHTYHIIVVALYCCEHCNHNITHITYQFILCTISCYLELHFSRGNHAAHNITITIGCQQKHGI